MYVYTLQMVFLLKSNSVSPGNFFSFYDCFAIQSIVSLESVLNSNSYRLTDSCANHPFNRVNFSENDLCYS